MEKASEPGLARWSCKSFPINSAHIWLNNDRQLRDRRPGCAFALVDLFVCVCVCVFFLLCGCDFIIIIIIVVCVWGFVDWLGFFCLYFFPLLLFSLGKRWYERMTLCTDLRSTVASLGGWQQRSPTRSVKSEDSLLRHPHLLSEI